MQGWEGGCGVAMRIKSVQSCVGVSCMPVGCELDTLVLMIYYIYIYIYMCVCVYVCGPGSSVGIATVYGLDGPGSNPGGDGIFRPSRPALVPTQPPVKWIPGLSRG